MRKFFEAYFPNLDRADFSDYENRSRIASTKLTSVVVFIAVIFILYSFSVVDAEMLAWGMPNSVSDPRLLPYFFLLALLAVAFVIVKLTSRYKLVCWVLGAVLVVMAWYTILIGGVRHTGPISVLFLPPVLIFGLGFYLGASYSVILCLGTFLLFRVSSGEGYVHLYEVQYGLRYSMILSFSCLFAMATEFSRLRIRKQLVLMAEKMEYLALKDPLTGLGNRRDFHENYEREKARMGRRQLPLCVCMCDIDYFKRFNDTHGHECGDMALKHVSQILVTTLRRENSAYRWGGEEFLIILPEASLETGKNIAERLRLAVEGKPLVYADKTLTITLSFGVTLCDFSVAVDENIRKVDALLYQAKENGRNQVFAG